MIPGPYDQLSDADLWALCAWREASGDGVEGMRGVAWNVWNRHNAWKRTMRSIILQPYQYSSMTALNPYPRWPADDDLAYAEAQRIVGDILAGRDTLDPTKGALYYANLDTIVESNRRDGHPDDFGWFMQAIVLDTKNHPFLARIEHHSYFK